jgi:biopolymer transport protein ExbD
MNWTAITLGALRNDPFFLILAAATGVLLLLQLILAILNQRKSGGAKTAGWSIVLAATTPLLVIFVMVLDVQFSHIAPLHALAEPPAPSEVLVFLTSAMGEVMTERALCGLVLLASALIGVLGVASTRKTPAPTGKIAALGICLTGAAVAAGVLMHTISLSRGFTLVNYVDAAEKSVLLRRALEEAPTYTFTLILAFILLFAATCLGFLRSARRRGTAPAIIAGGLAFLIGAGAFVATRGHRRDVEKLPALLESFRLYTQTLFEQPDVRLLNLKNSVELELAPVMVASEKQLSIEGYMVMRIEDAKTGEGDTIPDLLERLELLKKNYLQLHPGQPLPGKIILQADRETAGIVLRKVLHTFLEAGFTRVQLATIKPRVLQTSVLGELRLVHHHGLPFEITAQPDQGLELNDDPLELLARRLDRADAKPPVKLFLNPVLRISVMQSGKVLLDGEGISLGELDKRLAKAKNNRGIIFYYRESPLDEATTSAMVVLNRILDHGIPIRISNKPDFSDYIGPDGASHPL